MKNENLEKLYLKYYNEAKLYAYSLCKDTSTVDDLISDAFFKALKTYEGDEGSFKFWLFKVMKNLYIDKFRKSKRETALDDNMPALNDEIVSVIIKNDEYRALYNAIRLLKPNYSEVISLYYFDGFSVKEIAEITSQSIDIVKVTLYRARIKLKEILETDYGF